MKRLVFLVFLLSYALAKAQSINNYKYVVVDNQYEFQSEPNQYRLNEFIIFELDKYNFKAYRNTDELPADLEKTPCKAMYLTLKESGFLATNLEYAFRGCDGNVIFEFPIGTSRTKGFQKAYFEATRDAFGVLGKDAYTYEGPFSKPMQSTVMTSVAIGIPVSEVMEEKFEKKTEFIEVSKTIDMPAESKAAKLVMDYTQKSENPYSLIFNESGENFDLYNAGIKVGSGRKSAAGVYLVSTDTFTGIGFVENELFIIEYDKGGSLNRIKMSKDN
jgi:hypothetical protein